ncbi:MAG: phosphatidate cytidylyltransferase [Clostridiales bacterium]|nr:phosphatidate cytidylyltransferase [Clostridiales bacterium]
MFRTRLISGIVLVILAFAVIFAGGYVMAGVLCAISIIAFFELTKATGVHTPEKKINGLEIAGVAMIVLYYLGLYAGMAMIQANHVLHETPVYKMSDFDESLIYFVLTFSMVMFLIVFMLVYVFSFPKFKAGKVMACFFEIIYAPVLLSFLFIIREGLSYGIYLVWLVFLCSWGSDTCAYCVGILFGKHKMTPKLSPKKSVEGGIGGVVGAALLFGLYTYFVINKFSPEQLQMDLIGAMCLGAVGALISMIGDLAASGIKRDYEIKDYGKLIPGHGGIMDRFDSVIMVAPVIFFGLALIA